MPLRSSSARAQRMHTLEVVADDKDRYRLCAQHVILALQADPRLGAGGALEIKTWDRETIESAGKYTEAELPAIAVEIETFNEGEVVSVPDGIEGLFPGNVWIVSSAGDLQTRKAKSKEYAAAVEMVLQVQHYIANQLADLPASMAWAAQTSVEVEVGSADFAQGDDLNVTRAVALVPFNITLILNLEE